MPKIFTQTPRVVVILETCVQPDREKLDGIFKYVRFYGPWHLHIIQNRVGEQRLAHFETGQSNGIIVGQSMLDMEDTLARTELPLVLIDPLPRHLTRSSPFSRCSHVQNDSASVGIAAADYFLTKGFKRFAYVGEVLDRLWSQGRGQGFADRLRRAGFSCQTYVPPAAAELNDWAVEQARLLGREYLRLDCEASRARLRAVYERFGFVHHSDRKVGPYCVARYEYRVTKPKHSCGLHYLE